MEKATGRRVNIFVDSGDLSTWAKRDQAKLEHYIAYIKGNLRYIEAYLNMDVIGDPIATWKNQEAMEKAGLKPIPVYHLGEPKEFLDRIMKGYDYFAVRVSTLKNKLEQITALDWLFEIVCPDSNKNLPTHKVHGVDIDSIEIMRRYPWIGLSSGLWAEFSRRGAVLVPKFKEGKWVYNEDPWIVIVDPNNPDPPEGGQRLESFSPEDQEIILRYFEEKGIDILKRSGSKGAARK
jgi:hypothetical protein